MDTYPHQCQRRIREAREAINRMRFAKSVDECKYSFSSFLAASKNALMPLHHLKHIEGYEAWWAKKKEHLRLDPVARFFWQLRNEVEKAGKDPLSISYTIGGPTVLDGPLVIGSEGVLMGDPNYGWRPIDASIPGFKIDFISLNGVPPELQGKDLWQIMKGFLDVLDSVVIEAIQKFVKDPD